MYFGWWHPNSEPNHPNITSRPDAQFVAIGWELMEQVLEKPYCHPTRDGKDCNPNNPELRWICFCFREIKIILKVRYK
jgi:hypothetical protein